MKKTVILLAAVLAAALLGGGYFIASIWRQERSPEETVSPAPEPASGSYLAAPEDFLPQWLSVGHTPPEAVFSDGSGSAVPLETILGGEGVWLLFWASWCPDCAEQMEYLTELTELAAQAQVELILVDRLDARESREAAAEKLAQYDTELRCLYDENEKCDQDWGLKEIPSSVFLDGQGIVREYCSGVLTPGEGEGLLFRLLHGRDAAGLLFLQRHMLSGPGGVGTSTCEHKDEPGGADVLSESQGLMLLYALEQEDRALFEETWNYTREHLLSDGLCAWYVDGKGKKGEVNALLDDLRLEYALALAGEKWGEDYAAAAEEMRAALLRRCVNRQNGFVDFVELRSGRQAVTISLSYLDLRAIGKMAESDAAFQPVLERSESLLLEGRISEEFPLYYAAYDYQKKQYSRNELNTAEALYTLWNLSCASLLPEESLEWLRERVHRGDLATRYEVSGQPVSGYTYHSTAVYGLAALIAMEEGDEALLEEALRRMERLCVLDAEKESFGAYEQEGAEVYAFDQLIPLLVNGRLREFTA